MHFWTDKEGKKLTFKEFLSRWKQGMNQVAASPQYQLKAKLGGTRIMLIGFLCGFVMTLIYWENTWWVAIILFGGIVVTSAQYFGTREQIKLFKNLEKQFQLNDFSPIQQEEEVPIKIEKEVKDV